MTQHPPTDHGAGALNLAFAGSPDFAAQILEILLTESNTCDWRVSTVLTQPDRASGRGQRNRPSPTKTLALRHQLALHQPVSLRRTAPCELCPGPAPDLLVVVAYGLILPQAWLNWAKFGAINIHTSLLPRWRGAAPIERAIMAGDEHTGVCVMRMEAGLDTGAILSQSECRIDEEDDVPKLEQKLIAGCVPLLKKVLSKTKRLGRLPNASPQATEGVTYADKISTKDAQINWQQSALDITRQIRALTVRGGAQTWLPDGARLSIFKAKADTFATDAPTSDATTTSGTAPAGTLLPAGKGVLAVLCGEGKLNVIQARLNRGKGSLLSGADLLNGFPNAFRAGVQLGFPLPLKES